MPRNKRGGLTPRGGRGGRGGGRGRGGRFNTGTPPYSSATPGAGLGFTLADEARQTSQRDHSSWGPNSKLRLNPVKFVSAGNTEPLKQLDSLLQVAASEDTQTPISGTEVSSDNARIPASEGKASPPADPVLEPNEPEVSLQKETKLTASTPTEVAPTTDAAPSDPTNFFFDTSRDESNNNRKQRKDPVSIPDRPTRQDTSDDSSGDEVIFFRGRKQVNAVKPEAHQPTDIIMTQMQEEIQVVEAGMRQDSAVRPLQSATRKTRGRNSRRQKARQRANRRNSDDDALLADYIANLRESGEADSLLGLQAYNRRDLGGTESEPSSEEDEDESPVQRGGPSVAAILDNLSSSAQPTTGYEGSAVVDDTWRSGSELDDETLAKLIAGEQSGLDAGNGLTGDQLSESDSSSDDKRDSTNRPYTLDDFDPMDWERPSLRRKKGKGTNAKLTFDMSDSELEEKMEAAWSNDRLKKSQRKMQREELRALGMLGKRGNKPDDLATKYPTGISLEQVAEEVRAFLLGNEETISLPPMDKHARMIVHEIANKFYIKSKSAGKADHRRPVLHRTKRTLPYVASTFDVAINRINRRYFPRLDVKGKRSSRAPPIRSNVAAASYQDGEIVGAAAPELGTENRGRNMLEKMGWNNGTALGALDNKGILQPVTHAMKRSKAGLG